MKETINIFIGGFNLTDSINSFTKVNGFAANGTQDKYTFSFNGGSEESFPGFMVDIVKAEEQSPKTNKYAELFSAKLNNMDLVLLHKHKEWESWVEDRAANSEEHPHLIISDRFDYFLCLKQHTKPCLHWLNGGLVEIKDSQGWYAYVATIGQGWNLNSAFMNPNDEIRIKPAMPTEEELQMAKGKSLYCHSRAMQINLGYGWVQDWGQLTPDGREFWCKLAESIDYKEKAIK